MSENCELRRGLRRREKNANDEGAGHFEKPAPDARAAPPEAHESLISRETVAEVLLTGLFLRADAKIAKSAAWATGLRPMLLELRGMQPPARAEAYAKVIAEIEKE